MLGFTFVQIVRLGEHYGEAGSSERGGTGNSQIFRRKWPHLVSVQEARTNRYEKSTWSVEVIGFQSHPPTRSCEFYEAFFRVIFRDRDNPDDILVIGLLKRFKDGMSQRKQQHPTAWGKTRESFSLP